MSEQVLFKNARVFDGKNADCLEGTSVLVVDGVIQEVSMSHVNSGTAKTINVNGRTLIPGLIDAHVHACASDVDLRKIEEHGEAYRTAFAARCLGHALSSGGCITLR